MRAANIDLTGGTIKGEDEELFIRTKQKQYYAKDLQDIILRSSAQGLVRLSDVADIKDKWAENPVKNELDGESAINLQGKSHGKEDIIHISKEINKYIESFNKNNEIVKTKVLYDLSDQIDVMQEILLNNGIVGFLSGHLFLVVVLKPTTVFLGGNGYSPFFYGNVYPGRNLWNNPKQDFIVWYDSGCRYSC